MAARVARVFRLDPVDVLDNGGDDLLTMIRIAAATVISNDEKENAEKNKPRRPSRR